MQRAERLTLQILGCLFDPVLVARARQARGHGAVLDAGPDGDRRLRDGRAPDGLDRAPPEGLSPVCRAVAPGGPQGRISPHPVRRDHEGGARCPTSTPSSRTSPRGPTSRAWRSTSGCTACRSTTPSGSGASRRKALTWFHPWQTVFDADYDEVDFAWFSGGRLNASFNCVDRHLETLGDRTAIIWAQDEPGVYRHITYRELKHHVCRVANVLLAHGVRRGDRVCIYMTMMPELVYTMLACARIGAVHSVVFGGFIAESLRDRIVDARCRMVVTANEGLRGGKRIPLKKTVDRAVEGMSLVETVLVARRTDTEVPMQPRPRPLARRGVPASSARPAPTRGWAPRTRCSSSTPRAAPASRRACCTRPAATSSTPPSRTSWSSTTTPATSTSAPPTSAGSPATATSSTARSPTARPRCCSSRRPPIPTPGATGGSSTTSASTSSTRRPRRCARSRRPATSG